MKSTGMVIQIDDLGRILIPKGVRRRMDLSPGACFELFVDEDQLLLKRYAPACIFCGEAADVITYKEKKICRSCLAALGEIQ